jgi:hypothetical protein
MSADRLQPCRRRSSLSVNFFQQPGAWPGRSTKWQKHILSQRFDTRRAPQTDGWRTGIRSRWARPFLDSFAGACAPGDAVRGCHFRLRQPSLASRRTRSGETVSWPRVLQRFRPLTIDRAMRIFATRDRTSRRKAIMLRADGPDHRRRYGKHDPVPMGSPRLAPPTLYVWTDAVRDRLGISNSQQASSALR